jgi:hypothetical protein
MMAFNAGALLTWLGHWVILGIFVVMLAETGLLAGCLLPGDSLLLTRHRPVDQRRRRRRRPGHPGELGLPGAPEPTGLIITCL